VPTTIAIVSPVDGWIVFWSSAPRDAEVAKQGVGHRGLQLRVPGEHDPRDAGGHEEQRQDRDEPVVRDHRAERGGPLDRVAMPDGHRERQPRVSLLCDVEALRQRRALGVHIEHDIWGGAAPVRAPDDRRASGGGRPRIPLLIGVLMD
jgi:hypothetical protein